LYVGPDNGIPDFRGDLSLNNRQNQPFRALATTLSLLALSACAGTVPVAPTAVSTESVAPAAQPEAAAAPVAPAEGAAPATTPTQATYTVDGGAMLGGVPLADGQVQVFDAMTGAQLAVGGTGLSLAAAAANTDSQGQFSVSLNDLGAGQVAKIVVSKASDRVEALISGNPSGPAAHRVLANEALTVDEVSTIETNMASGVLSSARTLKAAAAAPIVAEVLAKLKARREAFRQALKSAPSLYPGLTLGLAGEEADKRREEALRLLVSNSGIQRDLSLELVAGLVKLSEAAASPDNRNPEHKPSGPIKLPGLPLTASTDATTGKVTFVNTRTGAQISGNADAGALSVLVRPRSSSRGNAPSRIALDMDSALALPVLEANASKPAVEQSEAEDDLDAGTTSSLTLTKRQLEATAATTYYNQGAAPFLITIRFELAPEDGGYALSVKHGESTLDRIFHFKGPDGALRMVSYDNFQSRGLVTVDPQAGSTHTPPNTVLGTTRSYHFQEPDGYVYDLHFSSTKLTGFALFSTGEGGAMRWAVSTTMPPESETPFFPLPR
jgi:hypothetical protein